MILLRLNRAWRDKLHCSARSASLDQLTLSRDKQSHLGLVRWLLLPSLLVLGKIHNFWLICKLFSQAAVLLLDMSEHPVCYSVACAVFRS